MSVSLGTDWIYCGGDNSGGKCWKAASVGEPR